MILVLRMYTSHLTCLFSRMLTKEVCTGCSRMQAEEEKLQRLAEGKDAASDEEIARRLQQQLNEEAAAASRRRTRKQPTFYSPRVLPCTMLLHGARCM